ncbi:MAG: glycoside hydrolase family 3 C-terminal domain-containing protein [Opitutaceae bacterium]
MKPRSAFFFLAGVAFLRSAGGAPSRVPYLDPSRPTEVRVDDLLHRLTLAEKVSLVHADSRYGLPPIPRLGIQAFTFSDGPHGVREETVQDGPHHWKVAGRTDDFATWLPDEIALAATWDPAIARRYGAVIGQEGRARGKDMMLGPGVNLMRIPLDGRNPEFLGEDPFLASRMAVGYIRGEQAQGVASCVKHFVCNNQETERWGIDVRVSERALRELYLPAFRAAVQQGGVWGVMAAYNRFRGVACSENGPLLNGILKGEWGFRGLVVSDWGAVRTTDGAVYGGLDVEMGTQKPYSDFYMAKPFLNGLRSGKYPVAVLDAKVRRILRVMVATGVLDPHRPAGSINTAAHERTARRVAEEAIVLLKNQEALLPLDPDRIGSIAVIGENAVRLQAHDGGSSAVKAFYEVTPLEGILRRVGRRANVTYSAGYGAGVDAAAVDRAVEAARSAEVAIVVGGLNRGQNCEHEGNDRKNLDLPYGQAELIERVAAANPRTIVVLIGGAPVAMDPWLRRVPALIDAWYPGMEGGNALAAVLFGDVDPSGKLPCTFPRRLSDSPAFALGAYPGKDLEEPYAEGLLVGYRWFDTKHIEPLFPFGYGLSYTRFAYSDLQLVPSGSGNRPALAARFTLKNVGLRAGAEVAQLYIHEEHPLLPRPEKELKGFQRVFLKPGESRVISIPLDWRSFAYYNPGRHAWTAQADEFRILVGASSRDIRVSGRYRLPSAVVGP